MALKNYFDGEGKYKKISDISTRLVVNKVSFKFKKDEIMNLVTKLETVTEGK